MSKKFEEAVHSIARQLLGLSGQAFFESLASQLSLWTQCDFAFVGEITDIEGQRSVQTLGLAEGETIHEPLSYSLQGTPCEQVADFESCAIKENVQRAFPDDSLLVEMEIQGYVGTPLLAFGKVPIGLIVVLHRQPLEDSTLAESLLDVFTHQTTSELERLRGAARVTALQSFHEQLLEQLPLDLVVFDLEGRFQYINPHAVRDPERRLGLIGKTEHDYDLKRTTVEAVGPSRRQYFEQVKNNGEAVYFEETLTPRGAAESLVYLRSLFPVRDQDNQISHVIGFGFDITQQKKTERELRESEAAYRAMFEDNSAVKLLIAADTGTIIDANTAARSFYGFSEDDMGSLLLTNINAWPADKVHEKLDAVRRGQLTQFQTRHHTADGEVRDVEVQVGPLEIRGQKLHFAIVQDVSERCKAQEALRQRESYYRTLIEHSLDVITILDAEGVIRFESPSSEWVLGYQIPERLGKKAIETVHPQDHKIFRALLAEASKRHGPATSFEYRCRHQNGSWRIIESRAADRLADPVVQGIVMHSRDVTERHQAEEAVRKSEEKYRRLFEQSKDVVYMSSPTGHLLDINQAGVELLGYKTKQELLTDDLHEDLYATPWHREQLQEELDRKGFAKDFEVQMKLRDGRLLNALVTSSAVQDESKNIIAYLGILRDVTSQRQLEEQFRQSQKMEAIGRLAGGLAHDFNNLLTAINGYGELLQHQLPKDDTRRTFVDEICSAGRRATDLTAKLLTLSRRKVVSPRVVDLNRMVHQLRNLLRRLIGEDIELQTRLEPKLYPVRIDPGQMEQVLLNLAINARDAMPTGGKLTLATSNLDLGPEPDALGTYLPNAGPYVRLSVSDTGIGMDPDVQQHIFEPFFTTKGQGKGTGLGLSTAYATVQQSGGQIMVKSTPKQGTTFHILLPRVADQVPQEAKKEALEESQMGDETILLVEDDPAVRRLAWRILQQQGYRVVTASNPLAALEIIDRNDVDIDLLVSDVIMPNMSGPDLATEIFQKRPDIRVLFMSGYTDDKFTGLHGLSNHDHSVIQKPFNAHTLTEKVREILDQD